MRILLAVPYIRSYQAHQFWKKALEELGHQVKVFWYNKVFFFSSQPKDKVALLLNSRLQNWRIKKLVVSFNPEIFLLSSGVDVLTAKTMKFIHSLGIKIALFSGVSPLRFATREEKKMLRFVDYCFVNDPSHTQQWLQLGAKKAVCLPISAIDPSFHRELRLTREEKERYRSDVCFVGSLSFDRQEKLIALVKLLPRSVNLKIWGYLYPGTPLMLGLKPYYQGEAWEEEAVKIFNATKIALNFLPEHMPIGGNIRTFEIPGCGAFQLASRTDPGWFVNGKEIVLFSSLKDLKEKIVYYLEHEKERRKIARAGYQRTLKEHTYERRFEKVLQLMKEK